VNDYKQTILTDETPINQRGGEPCCPSCGALLPATMDGPTLQEQHSAITDQIELADRKRDRAGV